MRPLCRLSVATWWWLRNQHRALYREQSCRTFDDYKSAVNRRLALHDFRESFVLNEDPEIQDKRATWIEFLNSGYWWHDRFTSTAEELQPAHDKAGQDLVDSNVLRPRETDTSGRSDVAFMRLQAEYSWSQSEVEKARAQGRRVYFLTQEDAGRADKISDAGSEECVRRTRTRVECIRTIPIRPRNNVSWLVKTLTARRNLFNGSSHSCPSRCRDARRHWARRCRSK